MRKEKKVTTTELSKSELNELRQLIEELDLVPLSVYPKQVRPLVLSYLQSIENEDVPFDSPVESIAVATYLSKRKKIKTIITEDDLILF